ncbi:hypothetical protein BJ166DRAFT_131426 [Pestalotiopsis sp. NC0098]|nr:hypothetical protein BJ166DRAFT_131426 [Pestalotiopsis sp. NC0098]
MRSTVGLPGSESPDLHLSQPSPEECIAIWRDTAELWKDALTVPLYIAEAQHLLATALAQDGGMTTWILVDKHLPPDQRQIFSSCETYQKRALLSDEAGDVEDCVVHGIASVFCSSEFRGRGFGTRLLKDLAKVLREWQSEHGRSIGSVLYSDVGKKYYSRLGWHPHPQNWHLSFPAVKMQKPAMACAISESELEALCVRDEAMIRTAMRVPVSAQRRVVILPDLRQILWHIRKEDFVTRHVFGSTPHVKGAIAGEPGKQVWAVWAHRYYRHPDHPGQDENVLYILRLVVEGDETATKPHADQPSLSTEAYIEQAAALKAVLQAAQAEAAQWRLDRVDLWEPSPLVQSLVRQDGFDCTRVERQEGCIASALWFVKGNDVAGTAPAWVNNEHYAWC